MEIVKHGKHKDPNASAITFECEKCGCIWKANEKEYFTTEKNMGLIFRTKAKQVYVFTCPCPECGNAEERMKYKHPELVCDDL